MLGDLTEYSSENAVAVNNIQYTNLWSDENSIPKTQNQKFSNIPINIQVIFKFYSNCRR